MVDLLKDWVRDIFIVVTSLCFAEIVLPQGNMKKYLRFIFSIIILGVVLSPLAHLAEYDFSSAALADEYYSSIGGSEATAYGKEGSGKMSVEPETEGRSIDDKSGMDSYKNLEESAPATADSYVSGSGIDGFESDDTTVHEEAGTNDLQDIQSFQFEKIYEKKICEEVNAAIKGYYPDLNIYEIEVIFNEKQGDERFAAVNLIVIKGEETEYVSNIIRCVAQRLGIEEEKLSYILPEENE